MTHAPPCSDPANDPEDWFIEKDGRQYADEYLVSEGDVVAHLNEVDPHGTRSLPELDRVWQVLEDAAVKAALVRRRHAKDKCFTQCLLRHQCLEIALTKPEPTHGTWGGYHPEELKKIRDLRDERVKRESHDADVTAEE